MKQGSRHRAAVIAGGTSFRGDQSTGRVREGVERDLPLLLATTLDHFDPECTIIVYGVQPGDVEDQGDAVRAAGWEFRDMRDYTLFRHGDRVVCLGFRDAMLPRHLDALITPGMEPEMIAMVLDRYHRLTGTAWRGTPGATALATIRGTWTSDRYQPMWKHEHDAPSAGAGFLDWQRPLNEWERTWGWVHTFDAHAAYLGSAINVECAWSTIGHTGPQPFDPRQPGYWLVQLDPAMGWLRDPQQPPLIAARQIRDGCVWVTTPVAHELERQCGRVDVLDSWTGRERRDGTRRIHPAGSRILRKFGEQTRDALYAVHEWPDSPLRELMIGALKRTYKDAVGSMQRVKDGGMRITRPDWGHHVIDLWRVTVWRTIQRIHQQEGVWPVRVATDSISYADSAAQSAIAHALNIGTWRLGGWKLETTHTTRRWLDMYDDKPKHQSRAKAGV